MLKRPDYELIVGSKKDADFGSIIFFGMGGIMTEILKDQPLGLPPLNRLLARRLMESTQVYKMLRGYRGRPPAGGTILCSIQGECLLQILQPDEIVAPGYSRLLYPDRL